MIRPCVGLLVAAALLALACSEAGESQTRVARDPIDVILVTWDTVRWDHVGTAAVQEGGSKSEPSHTPTWDRFAREGVLFTEARTPAPVTLSAHASILTGLAPPHHGARDNGIFKLRAGVPTLAEEFAEAGYLTAAFVSAEVLHRRHGLDRGFDHYDYFVHRVEGERTVAERRGDRTIDAALDWLTRIPAEKPLFLWVHLFDPHRVWRAPEPWRDRYDPYRAEIAFADAQTGRLLDQLTGFGRLPRALVVIASDHGEALGEHGEISHSYFAYDSTLRVPLLLWAGPKTGISLAAGTRIDGPVSLVDLAPTLRELSGLPARQTDGRSLVPRLAGEPPAERLLPFESVTPATGYGTAPIFGVLTPKKEVWIDLPRREHYDLARDPGELENLYGADDAPVADALFAQFPRDWPPSSDTLDLEPAARERLAALGYTVGSAASLGGRSTVDPKDLIDVHRFVADTNSVRNPRQLLAEVRALRAQYGPYPALARFEIDLLVWLGRPRDARDLLRGAASANPDRPDLQEELHSVEGQIETKQDQIRAIRRSLQTNPGDAKLRWTLAVLLHGIGEHAEAAALYREILASDPDNRDAAINLAVLLAADEHDDEAIAVIRALRSRPGYDARYDCQAGDLLAGILEQVEEGREAIRACEAHGGVLSDFQRRVLDGTFEGYED